MNNILILDLTANSSGWEFESAAQQKVALEQLGCTVYLEQFIEIPEKVLLLGYLNKVRKLYDLNQLFYDNLVEVQTNYRAECEKINNFLDQIDFVNIRCHGSLKDNRGYADIFCAKHHGLTDLSSVANFEVLLQLIPKLKEKNIFFTVCYGGQSIQSFTFDGLVPSDQTHIYSLIPMGADFSKHALTSFIWYVRNQDTHVQAFNKLAEQLKDCLRNFNSTARKDELVISGIPNSLLDQVPIKLWEDDGWENYVNSVWSKYLYMETPSNVFETIEES